MLSPNPSRPILLLHPDPCEARALQSDLKQAAIDHPILLFLEADEARDYLNAVLLAQSAGDIYRPCLVLFDEALKPDDVDRFRRWTSARPQLAGIQFVKLSSEPVDQPPTADIPSEIDRRPAQAILRHLVVRACPP